MKPKHFYSDLYHQDFYFCPKFTQEEYVKAVAKKSEGYSVDLSSSFGHCTSTSDGIFIWLKGDNIEYLGALCHESIHAANFMLESRGIHVSEKEDEPLTYLAQWIFEKAVKHMRVR